MPPRNSGTDFDWDAHWTSYDATARCNPGQIMRHKLVGKILCDEVTSEPVRLLDLGSGQGDMLEGLRRLLPKASLAGFELSPSGVEIGRQKVPEANLVVADLFKPNEDMTPFRGWATHAVCCEVLEHLGDPTGFLRAAADYIAPGGMLLVTVPSGPMSAFDKYIGHQQHFTIKSLSRVHQEAGFRPTRSRRAGFPFFNLYRFTVIARGSRLIKDARSGEGESPSALALAVMAGYRMLFRLNLSDSPFGWQLVTTSRKAS